MEIIHAHDAMFISKDLIFSVSSTENSASIEDQSLIRGIERHLLRHQQKDEEAGGTGLGVVQTRKRLWRDSEGRIVTKRPNPTGNNEQNHIRQSEMLNLDWQAEDDSEFPQAAEINFNTSLLSPPGTLLSTESMDQFSQASPESRHNEPTFGSGMDMFDFLANSAWGNTPNDMMDMSMGAPLDDMFQPDTG